MSDNNRILRDTFGMFATGVTVVTTMLDDAPVGITVNSFSSVSLDPPLVLFCIGKKNLSHSAFIDCANFAVNVLCEEQADIALRFARRSPEKWSGIRFKFTDGGSPILPGAMAIFGCENYKVSDAGDHSIILGRVLDLNIAEEGMPLVFYRGEFGRLKFFNECFGVGG